MVLRVASSMSTAFRFAREAKGGPLCQRVEGIRLERPRNS
jgi:hypothetical protein